MCGSYKEVVLAALIGCLSGVFFIGSLTFEMGSLNNPGPGFFPALVGMLAILASLAYLASSVRSVRARSNGGTETNQDAAPSDYKAVAVIAVTILCYPFLLYFLNFVTASFLATFVMLRAMKNKNILLSIVFSACFSVALYMLFNNLLAVFLPSGPVEQLLTF